MYVCVAHLQVRAASAKIQKKLLYRLLDKSGELHATVARDLQIQGISVPAQAQERAAHTWAVRNAVTAVSKVFDKFDLDRAMSKAYAHAQQTFNMSHAKGEECDPRCIHACKCSWEQVIAPSGV